MNKTALFYLTALLAPAPALASGIPALFPFAAQSHDQKGEVEMGWSTSINGTNNGVLDFKKKDDLKGQCDNKKCTISGKTTSAYSLPSFNRSPFTLPAFQSKKSSFNVDCSGSGTLQYARQDYNKIDVQGACSVKLANAGDVFIENDIQLQDSAELVLQPGDYWFNALKMQGDSKITVSPAGVVNFYVKGEVDVNNKYVTGSESSPVNIYQYNDKDVNFQKDDNDSPTWYGNIQTSGYVNMQNASKLYGAVQAEKLELSDSAEIHLDTGTYWYEELDLQDSAKILPQGSGLTTFYVKDEIDLQDNAQLGSESHPILAFVYGDKTGDDEGEVDLEDDARLYGYVYVQGELEMQDNAQITGAVNVVDLDMEGKALINYSAIPVSGDVHHFRLYYETGNEKLTAKACKNSFCSTLYRGAKLHAQNVNAHNTDNYNFNKMTDGYEVYNKSVPLPEQCLAFVIKHEDKKNGGTSPWPEGEPALRCYKDGVEATSCEICPDSEHESVPLVAYVYQELKIEKSELGNNIPDYRFYIGDVKGQGELKQGEETLEKKSSVTFPLIVNYNRAEAISLTIKGDNGKNGKNKQEVEYQLDLVFVPKQLRWSAADCGGDDGFVYAEHAASCTVLGKAGDPVALTLQAYGEGDKLIDDYSAKLQGIVINELTAELEQTREFKQGVFEFEQKSKASFETTSKIASVALIQAAVPDSCASYAVNDDGSCMLNTDGNTAIVGRTVPDRLLITAGSGKLEGGVAYRGKAVAYHQDDKNAPPQSPYFSVMACAANQRDNECELPSYTGEFAAGLDLYGSLTDELLDGNELQWQRQDDGTGEHIWRPEGSFTFDKDYPVAEQSLHIPLDLTLADHDELGGLTASTYFAGENDTLRFGFITLMDAEIPVNKEGIMFSKLHYYGESLKQLKEDTDTRYYLTESSNVKAIWGGNPMEDLSLAAESKEIKVDPYASELKDIIVTIEGLNDWLKPADKDNEGSLADPEALLDITGRFSPGERTFNRREATR
ncbi:hypothetical protein [Oceanimonas smirnovii]|uniref:hypothetical protein n=1 Tax=Oceanimonas smirnovii TaxID=264574 RepID=UPI003FD18E9A